MDTSIEFVNDWSELEKAVAYLRVRDDDLMEPNDYRSWGSATGYAISVLEEFVPRLLTQYAKLVELSFALTEGWETYATLNGSSGLYVPDHR